MLSLIVNYDWSELTGFIYTALQEIQYAKEAEESMVKAEDSKAKEASPEEPIASDVHPVKPVKVELAEAKILDGIVQKMIFHCKIIKFFLIRNWHHELTMLIRMYRGE